MSQPLADLPNYDSLGAVGYSGKLSRRMRQLAYLTCNLASHYRYLTRLRQFEARSLVSVSDLMRYKYIGDYVARRRSRSWGRKVILSHYRIVGEMVDGGLPIGLLGGGQLIWDFAAPADGGTDVLRIWLKRAAFAPFEGELELRFTMNERILAVLTFTLASGSLVQSPQPVVCLIGSLQGMRDCRAHMRLAAKRNGEISPFAMLLVAARAVMAAIGVAEILGVSAANQVALDPEAATDRFNYDEFWTCEGGILQPSGFFRLAPVGEQPPSAAASSAHRRRARLKRDRKAAIQAEIAQTIAALIAEGERDRSRIAAIEQTVRTVVADGEGDDGRACSALPARMRRTAGRLVTAR